MFAGKKEISGAVPEVDPNAQNRIAAGTSIVGEIKSDGLFRMDGSLTGNLTTRGKLFVGESGVIKGDVVAASAIIAGEVEGTLQVDEMLELRATARVKGEISTNKLTIEPGAVFNGSCDMSGGALASKMQQNAKRSEKQPQPEK